MNNLGIARYIQITYQSFRSSRLTQTVSWSLIISLGSALLSLFISVAVVRYLGAKQYGVYAFIMSIPGLAGSLILLGYPTLLIRQVSRWAKTEEWNLVRGMLTQSVIASILGGMVASVFVWHFGMAWGHAHRVAEIRTDLLLCIALMEIGALESLVVSVLQGMNLVVQSLVTGSVVRPAVFCLVIVGLAGLEHRDLSILLVMTVQLVTTCGVVFYQTRQFRRRVPGKEHVASMYRPVAWTVAAFPFLLKGVLTTVNLRADVLLIGALKGPLDAGIYNISTRGAQMLVMGLGAVVTAVQPTMAALSGHSDRAALQALLTRTSRLGFGLSVVGFLLFLCFGRLFLRDLYGQAFVYGFTPLMILCGARVVNAAVGSLGPFLAMTGRARVLAWSLFVEAVANVAVNLILIPILGIDGSAIATGGTMAVVNIVISGWLLKRSGVDVSIFGLGRSAGREVVGVSGAES